jgi:hypothetical protein
MFDLEPIITNTPVNKIYAELFRRGNFDFITTRVDKKNLKQELALQYLTDNETGSWDTVERLDRGNPGQAVHGWRFRALFIQAHAGLSEGRS